MDSIGLIKFDFH